MLEKDIKNIILHWLSLQKHCLSFVHDSVGIYDAKKKVYRQRTSRFHRNGISDILGIWRGVPLAIEVKTPVGKLSDHQKQFLADWASHGGIALVARCLNDVIEGLKSWDTNAKASGKI